MSTGIAMTLAIACGGLINDRFSGFR